MAGLYNEINAGRYNRALQKLLMMKGGAPAPTLSSDVIPTFPFEDAESAELRWIHSWNRFGAFISIAGVAATFALYRLRNQVNSNVIAVIEKLDIACVANDFPQIHLGLQAADGAHVVAAGNWNLDPRGGAKNPSSILSYDNLAAQPTTTPIWQGVGAANQLIEVIVDENQELPLLPGTSIDITSNTLNQSIVVSVWWRERAMEESERA